MLNALDVDLAHALLEACRSLAGNGAVHVVMLSGNGRAFMAGGDLAAMRAAPVEAADTLIGALHLTVQLIAEMPKPVLVSVHGAAAGAGMSLMLAADLAIATQDTCLSFACTDIATNCAGGASCALPRLLGLRRRWKSPCWPRLPLNWPNARLTPWLISSACCTARCSNRWPSSSPPSNRAFSTALVVPNSPPPSRH